MPKQEDPKGAPKCEEEVMDGATGPEGETEEEKKKRLAALAAAKAAAGKKDAPEDMPMPEEMTEEQKKAAAAKALAEAEKAKKMKALKCSELSQVEIFATGTHQGRTFTESDLNKIAENFKKFGADIQPPLVLGHDEHQEILQNSGLPSLGWLKEVSVQKNANGAVLVGKFEDVPELAKKAIGERRYKRISAELYENYQDQGLTLRRVALLGADIPEVKTLADVVALNEGSKVIYAFSEGGMEMPSTNPDPELVKRLGELEKQNKELTDALAREATDKRKASISSFCEGLKRDGRFLPKWDEMGISKFLEGLGTGAPMKFSEAKDAKEMTALDWMKEFMSAMPKLVKLDELAAQSPEAIAALKATGQARSEQLNIATQNHMAEEFKKGRKMTYVDAVREVAKANPALVE